MKFKAWGVRGSLPTPLTPDEVFDKVSRLLSLVEPGDVVDDAARQAFLDKLTWKEKSTIGGNTTCVELVLDEETSFLFDCGSGIKEYGRSLSQKPRSPKVFHIFMTHFHADHIQGLPFFSRIFDPSCTFHFYSPDSELQRYLENNICPPYFPLPFAELASTRVYHTLNKKPLLLQGAEISWMSCNHPGKAYAYRVDFQGKRFIFSTDSELEREKPNKEIRKFYQKADVLIHDAQYTPEEADRKKGWGHSSGHAGVDFSLENRVAKLYLFHYEPLYSDREIEKNYQDVVQYLEEKGDKNLELRLAREGLLEEV